MKNSDFGEWKKTIKSKDEKEEEPIKALDEDDIVLLKVLVIFLLYFNVR